MRAAGCLCCRRGTSLMDFLQHCHVCVKKHVELNTKSQQTWKMRFYTRLLPLHSNEEEEKHLTTGIINWHTAPSSCEFHWLCKMTDRSQHQLLFHVQFDSECLCIQIQGKYSPHLRKIQAGSDFWWNRLKDALLMWIKTQILQPQLQNNGTFQPDKRSFWIWCLHV